MEHFVGVDVCLERLDTFSPRQGSDLVLNCEKDICAFLATLPEGTHIAMESTGGYGMLLARHAAQQGHKVYVLPPAKIHHHRKAGPDRGKTDRIDTRVICDYIRIHHERLHPYVPLPQFEAELRDLSRRRDGLVRSTASLRKKLKDLGDPIYQIESTMAGLYERIKQLTLQIEGLLLQDADAALLATIPGVKTQTIAAVLPVLRTIPFKSKYALDSWAGIDLTARESGRSRGRRHLSKEGDKYLRKAIYMCAMSASRSRAWRDYYLMQIEVKKLARIQALNALGRKILHTIYGVYRSKTASTLSTT